MGWLGALLGDTGRGLFGSNQQQYALVRTPPAATSGGSRDTIQPEKTGNADDAVDAPGKDNNAGAVQTDNKKPRVARVWVRKHNMPVPVDVTPGVLHNILCNAVQRPRLRKRGWRGRQLRRR